MLVLSRKLLEVIRIGPEIRVIVVRIGAHAVRIGIEAPDGVTIIREEILAEDSKGHVCGSGQDAGCRLPAA